MAVILAAVLMKRRPDEKEENAKPAKKQGGWGFVKEDQDSIRRKASQGLLDA